MTQRTPRSILGNFFRRTLPTYLSLTIGALVVALSVILFLAPFNIAPSGISGIAVILNATVGTSIGLVVLVLNIPIQILSYYFLPGGLRTIWRTGYVLVIFSFGVDVLAPYFPPTGISDDVLLNAIFGGVMGGLGAGLVYRTGGNFGGTSTLALIVHRRTGLPLNTAYIYTDALVLGLAGLVFGWQAALYAVLTLFIDGLASSYMLEGPGVIRTAVIVTNEPEAISQRILHELRRGVTGWKATGMYTGQERTVLYVSVARSQAHDLRELVMETDPGAFLVIGQGQAAYGEGFQRRPSLLDQVGK